MLPRLCAALACLALATSALAQATLTEGEVRKVNTATGRVTLKHGEIRNLGMPPMTMTFAARDKALLKDLKPGDKVRFAADMDAAVGYVVTVVERVR